MFLLNPQRSFLNHSLSYWNPSCCAWILARIVGNSISKIFKYLLFCYHEWCKITPFVKRQLSRWFVIPWEVNVTQYTRPESVSMNRKDLWFKKICKMLVKRESKETILYLVAPLHLKIKPFISFKSLVYSLCISLCILWVSMCPT